MRAVVQRLVDESLVHPDPRALQQVLGDGGLEDRVELRAISVKRVVAW